ncbi:MAG TPA: hypothetical protein VMN36_01680 [Verrucomicrobiales bacterium]|nr:hypothetical protein [Verrucomicrobiales bacterium]
MDIRLPELDPVTHSQTLFRWLGILTLFVWGTIFLYFYLSGRVVNYLADGFRPAALLGGLFLYVLATFNLLTVRAGKPAAACGHSHATAACGHDHANEADHEHTHSHHHGSLARARDIDELVDTPETAHSGCDHGPEAHSHDHRHEDPGVAGVLVSFFILLAPVLAAASFTRDQFFDKAIINRGLYSGVATAAGAERFWQDKTPAAGEIGNFTLADLETLVDRSAEGNYLLDLVSIFYAAGDVELQRVLTGLPVETTGQILPERANNEDGRRLRLFRLFMECCANDMRPLGIPIEFKDPAPQLREKSWVKVIGKLRFPTEDGVTVSVLEVDQIEPTEEPRERLLN